MPKRDRYDLIVFDWDGTLMDSEARIVECLQGAAADAELPVPTRAAARDVIGLGLAEALHRLFPGSAAAQQEALVEHYRRRFLTDDTAGSLLFPGVAAMLEDLANQDLLLAVATGKSRSGLDRELERTGLGPIFQFTRCADEAHSKPHPQMLLDILDRLGMDAARTLVVGDTAYDMEMATNAGSAGLGVATGVHAPSRLLDAGALDCVNAADDLPTWLAGAA